MGVYCAGKARGGLATLLQKLHPVNNFSRHQCLCYTLHKHHLLQEARVQEATLLREIMA